MTTPPISTQGADPNIVTVAPAAPAVAAAPVAAVAAPILAAAPQPPVPGRIAGYEYPSDHFASSDASGDCPLWSFRSRAEDWEKQRDACVQGNYATGCALGVLTRLRHLGRAAIHIPLAGAGVGLQGLRGMLQCGWGALLYLAKEEGCSDCCREGVSDGCQATALAVDTVIEALEFPLQLAFTEGLSGCGQHKFDLYREKKEQELEAKLRAFRDKT